MHTLTFLLSICLFGIIFELFFNLVEVIYVSENAPSPKHEWWIKSLNLYETDRRKLLDGKKLNDALINACQRVLSQQFPNVVGFEDTNLGVSLKFSLKENAQLGVQILHIGMKYQLCLKLSVPR